MPEAEHKETVVEFDDVGVLQTLAGEHDAHLRIIEGELEVRIRHHQQGVIIAGLDNDVDLAADLLRQLGRLIAGGERIFSGDVERALRMLSQNRKLRLADLYRDQIVIAGRKHSITPKTIRQKRYIEAIRGFDVVFGIGPAGTGKTYLAMAMGLAALLRKEVKRVVLCRPAVEAGEKLGFLPGDMAEKVNPYLRPLYDALHDMVDYERAHEMLDRGLIEVAPLAFMRGRTLANAFVILDEAQNTSKGQMKMFLTRLGADSKCVVTGDITQIDLPGGVQSGLVNALNVLGKIEGIATVYFTEEDVIRHPLVARIIQAYREGEDNQPPPD